MALERPAPRDGDAVGRLCGARCKVGRSARISADDASLLKACSSSDSSRYLRHDIAVRLLHLVP